MTLGKKLALGFSAVLLLTAALSITAHVGISIGRPISSLEAMSVAPFESTRC